MLSISYHGQPFFRNYGLLLVFCISFSHSFDDFMRAHYHYICHMFFNMKISQSFCLNFVHKKGILWVKHFFTLTHFCILHLITTTQLIYAFPSFVDYMHNIGLISKCGTHFFTIIGRVCNIKISHSAKKMHSLVSIGVRFIHVTFLRFSYT
jgi:hypothetical protein